MDTSIIPLAITMMAGPQIMTAVIFVAHPTPVRASVAFLIGLTTAMLLETTIWYLLADTISLGDSSDKGSLGYVIQYGLVALLLVLAIRTYRHREHVEPPKWLGSLLEASPARALALGFLLIFLMPTDVASMLTVGVNLQHEGHALLEALPFWALTLLIAALPLLTYLLFRHRAERAIPKVRDWMGANAWLVNILVLGIFIFLILS